MIFSFLIAGCGGGGGGTTVPDPIQTSTPVINPTPNGQGNALSTTGTVYKNNATNKLIVLPTGKTVPSDYIPVKGIIVKSTKNPSYMTRTDENGNFDLSEFEIGDIGDLSQIDIVFEDPNTTYPVTGYPVLGDPMPASQLTDLKIAPPYEENVTGVSIQAGNMELFYVVGKSGGTWHPVLDTVTWSVSSENIGSFTWDNIFVAGNPTSGATGNITAQLGDKTFTTEVTIITAGEIGAIKGKVLDKNGTPVVYAMVEAETGNTIENYSFGLAVTDENGEYTIENLPNGTYTVKVSSLYGQELAKATVTLNSTSVEQNFTVTTTSDDPVNPSGYLAMVQPEKSQYNPGEDMLLHIVIGNYGSQTLKLTYDSVKFTFVKDDPYNPGSGTVIQEGTGTGGTIEIPAFANVNIPGQDVKIHIPENISLNDYYFIKGEFKTGTGTVQAMDGFIILGSIDPLPTIGPLPTSVPGSATPTPKPTATSNSNDYWILEDIKYKLSNINLEIKELANNAYAGEDVSEKVNSSSDIQYDLKDIKSTSMLNLQTINYSPWQTKIDNIIQELNYYVSSKDYNYLYNASSTISSLNSQIADAQSTLPAAAYHKKLKVK